VASAKPYTMVCGVARNAAPLPGVRATACSQTWMATATVLLKRVSAKSLPRQGGNGEEAREDEKGYIIWTFLTKNPNLLP
jgi:hypothetical protein